MNKRMIGFLVLVLMILAFAMFAPNGINAAGPKQYKIINGSYSDVESEVTKALNDGWSLAGGVAHYASGYSQAVVK